METVTNTGCPKELQVGVVVIGWLGATFSILDFIIIIFSLVIGVTEVEYNAFVTLATFLVQAEISICLMVAVGSKHKRILLLWLLVSIILLLLLSIVFLFSGVNMNQLPLFLQTIIVSDTIGLCFWMCVYSWNQKSGPTCLV